MTKIFLFYLVGKLFRKEQNKKGRKGGEKITEMTSHL